MIIFIMWCFSVPFIVEYDWTTKTEKQQPKQIKQQTVIQQSLYDSIYNEILKLEIEHPEIVYSQVLHETDSLRSNLFKTNHNMFGMKCCGQRATTSNQVLNGYAYYANWRESLIDYALLQMSHYKNLTNEEYYERLRLRYASDKKYVEKLKQFVKWKNQ